MKDEECAPFSGPPVEWSRSEGLVDYPRAVEAMEARVADITAGRAGEAVWLLEHPPVYTAGTSANSEDLVAPERFPVFKTGRGGQYTYHGPGQRVVYVMLDVRKRYGDVRAFVRELEGWTIDAIAEFGIVSHTTPGRVGVWVPRRRSASAAGPGSTSDMSSGSELGSAQVAAHEDKIAAIGIRLRRWVSFHGIAINVSPDLEHFSGIVPCGISDQGVTSLTRLAPDIDGLHTFAAMTAETRAKALMSALDEALLATFKRRFGEITPGEPLLVSA